MFRNSSRNRRRLLVVLLGTIFLARMLWGPVLAALLVGLGVKAIGMDNLPAWVWLPALPVLYLAWLFALLLCFVLETTLCRRFYEKPRRLEMREDRPVSLEAAMLVTHYARGRLLMTLPLANTICGVTVFTPLFLRAYSTRVHIGPRAMVFGFVWDPDITFIGRGTVVGDGSRLVAHSVVRTPRGMIVFQSAPIVLGPNVTVGGGAQVEMGVVIGAGSLVEPCSHVTPFTRIPAGEVWGGEPAVFRRKREPSIPVPTAPGESFSGAAIDSELPALVAHALGLPPAQVTCEISAANCSAWDSIGRMAIVAALYDRYGVAVAPEGAFRLNTLADLKQAIRGHLTQAEVRTGAFSLPDDPELLPLCDLAEATAALAHRASMAPVNAGVNLGHLRVVVASSFTAEPLAPALKWWSRAFGVAAEVQFSGFNQVPQALLEPGGLFRANRTGLNVVLLRPEDLISTNDPGGEAASQMVLDAMARFVELTGGPLLAADLPPVVSTSFAGDPASVGKLRERWRERLNSMPGVEVLPFAEIVEEIGTMAARDEAMERAASAPYSVALYQRLGIAVSRFARKLRNAPKKVLALDCDGTLWRGVVAEDGVAGITVPPESLRLQEKAREFHRRGVLLALASKNAPEDVWAVFDRRPDMALRREDIAAAQISWRPKSESLRALAAQLNLGLDAFALLDDNPGERAEVAANCPGVVVVPPDSAGFAASLERLWAFDAAVLTAEDRARGEYLRREAARDQARDGAADLRAHLQSLGLRVEIRRARRDDFPRVAQLTQKTNQFNLSLRRRTEAEIAALAETHEIRVASARDRFGDYGMVGVGILSHVAGHPKNTVMDTVLLSCRALGRGVEETFLHDLFQVARARSADRIEAPFVRGPRNQPMREFLLGHGFREETDALLVADPHQPPPLPAHVTLVAAEKGY